jgi:2'-5' RNA ligase
MRLFVALDLPAAMKQTLAALSGGVEGARWMPPETFHITLRFIGEVGRGEAAAVDATLAAIAAPAFTLKIAGVGAFGQGRETRALWAGVERAEPLLHLHRKIDRALAAHDLEPDRRKFAPHVTLARLKAPRPEHVNAFLAHHAGFDGGRLPVTRFALFESFTGRTGAHYEQLAEYPLPQAMPPL